MTLEATRELEELAVRVREHGIRMAAAGGCYIGSAFSCADLLVYLYREVLRVSPATAGAAGRDYFFLSKGHAVPALYGVLAELGFVERERLAHHLKTNDSIYWHPHPSMRGVESAAGSLGHLLSVGIGVALDMRLRGEASRVTVLMGDGELNEGTSWEGFLVAQAMRLENLWVVIDRNGLQANQPTEALLPLEPLEAKFHAFGWHAVRCDGHDFAALERAFQELKSVRGRPGVLIADTVRGRGLPSMEQRADRWFASLSAAEAESLAIELRGARPHAAGASLACFP